MNRFFIGLIAGAASVVGGTYFYCTKIKKEIDEKGVFHRDFFGGKFIINLYGDKEEFFRNKNKEENNNATTEA